MFDVAIIGGGPVGALAANILGKAGVKTLIVEKEAKPFPLPRAVHLDHEMVRLLQSIGIEKQVLNDMRDTQGHLHIGADQGVIRYMGTVGKPRPFGWSNDYFFYQPELEDHLRTALSKYPNVELRLGTEFEVLNQTDNQVEITLNQNGKSITEHARWLIACDGSCSSVRKQLNIALDDLKFEEPWLVVDVEVDGDVHFPDLTGVPDEADLQQLSIMMCDPKRPATIVPGRGNHRRWELMLLPGENDEHMMQPEKVSELLAPYLTGVPHNFVRASTYRFHGLVAEQWQKGNVFLAGDAAHQTPPFFGQGMCHGFRDVANIAWKMAMILNNRADDELLTSYQIEREPHVRAVINAAINAGKYICVLDPAKAALRDEDIRQKVLRNELPTTAADLIPAIETGIIAQGSSSAGRRFIQPWLPRDSQSVLLDDIAQGQWRLFVSDEESLHHANEIVRGLDIKVFNAAQFGDNNDLLTWLFENKSNAVLVRPDFYIYGTAKYSVGDLIEHFKNQFKPETD